VQFWNSFGTETPVEAAMDRQETLNLKGLYGGRSRARTADLLLVRQAVLFRFIDCTGTYRDFLDVIIV
jgi:hypothetical protein